MCKDVNFGTFLYLEGDEGGLKAWGFLFTFGTWRRLRSRGQRYIGKKLSNADKLALVKLSAKLSISKN